MFPPQLWVCTVRVLGPWGDNGALTTPCPAEGHWGELQPAEIPWEWQLWHRKDIPRSPLFLGAAGAVPSLLPLEDRVIFGFVLL